MAGQDDLDALIRGYADSPAYQRDLERQRQEAERQRAYELMMQREAIEREKREGSVPGRVRRGLERWINPDPYTPPGPRLPANPGRNGGVRGALDPSILLAQGMLAGGPAPDMGYYTDPRPDSIRGRPHDVGGGSILRPVYDIPAPRYSISSFMDGFTPLPTLDAVYRLGMIPYPFENSPERRMLRSLLEQRGMLR